MSPVTHLNTEPLTAIITAAIPLTAASAFAASASGSQTTPIVTSAGGGRSLTHALNLFIYLFIIIYLFLLNKDHSVYMYHTQKIE